ncbi:MAG: glycoside hydrolase family 9 protein [Lachnospiraceae bacterium]|nr:glycoside hydrolase family 9 protein [Lachnospiraceae bacterium]
MKETKGFKLNESGYFKCGNVDIMAFNDYYPAGHQSGVTLIMGDRRLVSNGDVRFEQTPGQWQPLPKQLDRKVLKKENSIVTRLKYPDENAHLKGFNPMIYPDFCFEYDVTVIGTEDGANIKISMDRDIPAEYEGRLFFNLELFPGAMFGKSYICGDKTGIFPRQPLGPGLKQESNLGKSLKMKPKSREESDSTADMGKICKKTAVESADGEREMRADADILTGRKRMFEIAKTFGHENASENAPEKYEVVEKNEAFYSTACDYNPIVADDLIASPYATGKKITIAPESEEMCFSVESFGENLSLYDGRFNHNNGWFVISIPLKKITDSLVGEVLISPKVNMKSIRKPSVQVSQVGYHPLESKKAIIELDARDGQIKEILLEKLDENGAVIVKKEQADKWGKFLRYNYLKFDFSEIREEGIYRISYGEQKSNVFRISRDVYERGVWQPVLEYFLPVQMCHMRVNEKYRVWHGLCHMDDARMAPEYYNHFDGAFQKAGTLTKYKSGEHICGLNCGGWHDAGDFDLRIESQSAEVYNLSMAFEEFGVYLDETTIDQKKHVTEIHEPDGRNDILEQIEHGVLSIIGGYKALGRLYKQIICSDLRQYVLLGDAANMTAGSPDNPTERLVFTEDNPVKELTAAAHLAAASRALKGFNDELAADCLEVSEELYDITGNYGGEMVSLNYDVGDDKQSRTLGARIHASSELLISTGDEKYKEFLHNSMGFIRKNIRGLGWIICRSIDMLDAMDYDTIKSAMPDLKAEMDKMKAETPYGIPYRPNIWGAGWAIQGMGSQYYFLHKTFPDIFGPELLFDALQFILGCHPGENTESFASGVGVKSATVAYGANRADWSYIPGGVISGTALIQPDLPELLDFPFLWQQKEYVIGGGSTNYLMLALAVKHVLEEM